VPHLLGNGVSTSPSNTTLTRGQCYPLVTIYDNALIQHRLVVERLGIQSIALAVGGSMGAQQAYQWAALFPDVVRRLAVICGAARTAPHTHVFLEGLKAALTADPRKDPGSWSPDARNIYEEGVSIPAVRLYRAGVRNEELLETILANTRLRDNNYGDLMAQISAAHAADVRTRELLADHGADVVNACVDSLFDYVEAQVRAEIEKIPDGTYTAEDWVDSDGVSGEPVRVRVAVTVAGSDITLDYRDNEPQRSGACGNAPRVCTEADCRATLKYLFGPDTEANDGFYRPMTLLTTPGTVTHSVYPAPMTVWDNMGRAISEVLFFALAPVIPERVAAGIFGGVQAMAIAGAQPATGEAFIHFMPYAGGWGARSTKDGINAMCPHLNGDNFNVPCEVIEANYPLRVERYELIQDSGGAGRFRGGIGVRIDYRVLSGPVTVSASLARYRFEPVGLVGGLGGMCSSLLLNAGTPQEQNRPMVGGAVIDTGALISHRCGGGGGFGPPAERDPQLVETDVAYGYVSAAAAQELYGREHQPTKAER
jgi:N-methylhydantoinase B